MKKLLLLFLFFSISDFCQAQQSTSLYEFPIQPGTNEWVGLSSGEEKIKACQIPPNIIGNMETASLLQVCLAYPLIGHIYAYNDLQSGFDAVWLEFNGFQALMERKDAGVELLKIYEQLRLENLSKEWDLIEEGKFAFNIEVIELLLAQTAIIKNLSSNGKRRLLVESLKKFKEKERSIEIFGYTGLTTSALIMSRVLRNENFEYKDPDLKGASYDTKTFQSSCDTFLNKAQVVDANVIISLVRNAQLYLNQ